MLTAGMVFAVLAAALHVLIFYMESIAWEGALARKTFGGTPEEVRPHAFYAFNQGFYNLFLALQAIIGVVLAALGYAAIGAALILSMTDWESVTGGRTQVESPEWIPHSSTCSITPAR